MPTSEFTGKLQDKKVVVVGGSSGIGFAVAQACLEFGAEVVIASSSQKKVDAAVERLKKSGDKVSGKTVDLKAGKEGVNGIGKRMEELLQGVGKFDHYVHSAGESLSFAPIEEIDLQAAQDIFDVRYTAAMAAAKAIKKHDLLKENGSLVLTSGTVYLKPGKNWSQTAGVAGAVVSLTRSLAVDLAPLRVNCVVPGPVQTELWDGMPEDQRKGLMESFSKSSLTGKVATPNDTAETYLYFMRDTSVTGQALTCEGGHLLK